jgi:NAD(P)-dependent dehydrogenase (short-subunit alcohol dehydrogenase family)
MALDIDENGDPKPPSGDVLEINLISVVNTTTLAAHYLKDQTEGGSIVIMGSSTGLHPVRAVDYCKPDRGSCCELYHS